MALFHFHVVDEQDEGLCSLYTEMKGTIGEMVSLSKETYMLQKTIRAIQRAEASSSFEFIAREEHGGSGQDGGDNANLDL